jgi:ppGpp synthetase/RelA/SpoT-type nucleotidyltranferase
LKSAASLREKLVRKRYRDPAREITDLIGVRVVLYYESEISDVISSLSRLFQIDKDHSTDKRSHLRDREFGYRSVHLIVSIAGRAKKDPGNIELSGKWFEIQIRSLLEHAWASIDHEIVYKSGIKYPKEVRRRFASIAGTLEILDREFLGLRDARRDLVEAYAARYAGGNDMLIKLDAARLVALMNTIHFPITANQKLPIGISNRLVRALAAIGLINGKDVVRHFKTNRVRIAIRKFAANSQIAVNAVSHIAIVSIIVGTANKNILTKHLADLSQDPRLLGAFSSS